MSQDEAATLPEAEVETESLTPGIKLFGEWGFEGIDVRDIGLERYLNLDPVFLPPSCMCVCVTLAGPSCLCYVSNQASAMRAR